MRSGRVVRFAVGCLVAGCSADPAGASPEVPDAGFALDAGTVDVAGIRDAGIDRGTIDAGAADATRPDVGTPDAGRDAGRVDVGVADVGRDAGRADVGVADTGTPDAGALPAVGLALPAWDAATVSHVREVRARGVALGARLTVFAKIGDSITESGSFLSDVGFGWGTLGAYTSLEPTVTYFRATVLSGPDGPRNSFNRASACATAGWTTGDALAGGASSPLRRELAAIRPAWAIVMYGTNDIDRSNLTTFRANLSTIVDLAEAAGAVVAVSTIPDRNDGAGPAADALRFNDAIRALAAARHIPLLDYWAALQPLPSHGVSSDRIHPSVYVTGGSTEPADFTAAGLRYGYNVRNLTALQMLDRMRNLP